MRMWSFMRLRNMFEKGLELEGELVETVGRMQLTEDR